MKNMNVYIVIYEQQRDKVYNDMQEALHKAQDTNERLRDILSLSYHNPNLGLSFQQKTPTRQQGFGMKLKGKTTCNLYETSRFLYIQIISNYYVFVNGGGC